MQKHLTAVLALLSVLNAGPAFADETSGRPELYTLAEQAIRDRFPDMDIGHLKASMVQEDGRAYITFALNLPNTVGGGVIVVLDEKTGEVIGALRSQ